MRYELKHDKLAAQIFVRASAAAKARRRAAEVYVLYTEKNRLLTIEELEDLAPFLPVLSPPLELQQLMERSRASIREKEEVEKVRLERELKEKQGLLEQAERQRKRATRLSRIGLILAVLAMTAGGIATFFWDDSKKSAENYKKQADIARNQTDSINVILNKVDSLLVEEKKAQMAAQDSAYAAKKERAVALKAKQAALDSAVSARQERKEANDANKKATQEQIRRLKTDANAFIKESRFRDALNAYDLILGFSQNIDEQKLILNKKKEVIKQLKEFEFNQNKDIGLSLKTAKQCLAAIPYLQAAQTIHPEDSVITLAIRDCLTKTKRQ